MRRKNTKFIDPRYFMDEKREVLNENAGVAPEGYPIEDLVAYFKKAWVDDPENPSYWDSDWQRLRLNVVAMVSERQYLSPGEPNPYYIGRTEYSNSIVKYVESQVKEALNASYNN